ncbi:MAG: S41 family peptidase [Blastocatellia bacterium]|nr:S41 family peptidase [Blastocatellia bacterium]MBK6424662.1 S41 family peptidase [Blastocatellia bacterium]
MTVVDRTFLVVGVAALSAAIAFGGLWDRQSRAAFATGDASSDSGVQEAYADALEVVKANYAGATEIETVNKYAILGMLRVLDPHSSFLDSREFSELRNEQQSQLIGIGVTINPRNGRVYILSAVPGTPAEKAGLRYGDAIVGVDGKSTEDLSYGQVVAAVRGERGKSVAITVDRVGVPEPVTLTIVRESVPLPTIRNHFMIGSTVGYVGLTAGFSSTTDSELGQAISDLQAEGMQQLILDLRRNPGGLLDEAIKVAQRFLPAGERILIVRGREGGSREERIYTSKNDSPESMPLVVLIDDGTASASEVVTGALQDHDRALVVGQTSFGKGLVQTVFDLNFETGLTLTTAKYYTPTGRSIQRDYANTSLYDYFLHRTMTIPDADATIGEPLLTDLGRQVYGGGGIRPDIKVDEPAGTTLRGRLFGSTFEFARHLVAGQFSGLRQYRIDAVDFNHTFRGDEYKITDDVIAAYRQFIAGRQKDFPVTDAQITANLEYVRNRIREEVITAAYGTDVGGQLSILNDVVAQRALEVMSQASEMAENARALRDRQ